MQKLFIADYVDSNMWRWRKWQRLLQGRSLYNVALAPQILYSSIRFWSWVRLVKGLCDKLQWRNSGKKILLIKSRIYEFVFYNSNWPGHSTGSQSLASHHRGLGLLPGQSMWDLWWTKWHWDKFFSKPLFPLSISFQHCSIFTHISSGGWTMGPLVATVPQTHSLPS
jgi:hypothetical protein